MSNIQICLLLLISSVLCQGSAAGEAFTYVGRFNIPGVKSSEYYLSNVIDERNVADARAGCHDGWKGGQLVAIETTEEHDIVRGFLSTNGITDATRVWTTGEHGGSDIGWVWFYYATGTSVRIQKVEEQPWVSGVLPESGCLSVGGRDLTYAWQSHDCSMKRRYLCEVPLCSC